MYGLDIGGTKEEFAVFDDDVNLVHSRRIATPATDYVRFVRSISDLVEAADERFGPVDAIGVGVPGIRDREGLSFAVNVPCITGRNVQRDLSAELSREIAVINDGRAFALSEAYGGAGEGRDPMIGVILGTGVFGGYCIGGKLRGGRDGVAGEWGHLSVAATITDRYKLPLYRCGCGKQGCIEAYVSGRGMTQLHTHVAGSAITPEQLVRGLRTGDETCKRAFDMWIDCVASCFAQLTLHINPEVIVVGGGLSNIRELYSQVPGVLSEHLFSGLKAPDVVPARFGDSSGVRGAAIYAAQRRDCAG